MAKIRPLSDNILLKPAEAEEKTASGILLPDSAKEKSKRGKVIATFKMPPLVFCGKVC